MRISDWSSDVCSSDLPARPDRLRVIMRCQPDLGKDISAERGRGDAARAQPVPAFGRARHRAIAAEGELAHARASRSEEHTSELQSLMRISYAVFCLKKKKIINIIA